MKYVKTLGPVVVAATALLALAGATASATVLCKNNKSTTSCSEPYGVETEITSSLATGTKAKLTTSFKTIECGKSTVAGKAENLGGETETVKAPIETLSFEECNCTVSVLKKGMIEIHSISENTNGTVTETGSELTASCSTIFGTVHCIYATEGTDLGTLTGGKPANIDWSEEAPRLTTSGLCDEEAAWEATYKVTSPEPLYVTAAAPMLEFKSTASPVVFYGSQGAAQHNEWTVDGSNRTTCKNASYESKSINTPTPAILLTPSFRNCEVLEYAEDPNEKTAILALNGCQFELLQPNVSLEGTVAIRCLSGNPILFFGEGVGKCEALIGETGNTTLAVAKYTNLGGNPSKFEVNISLSGITVDKKKDGWFCNLNGTGVVKNGTFKANVILEGKNSIGVSVG